MFRDLEFEILSGNQKGAGPCATESCEPRQVRKEATVSRQFCVPQDHLAPVFLWECPQKSTSGVLWLCRSGSHRHRRHFAVLTYSMYAPRVKMPAALLDGLF